MHSSVILTAFTHTQTFTQTLLHTDTFTHRRFYTQTLLHSHLTQRGFYTQKLAHTEAFTHRSFLHTQNLTHRRVYTQTLLHTDTLTHTNTFYTQRLLHTEAFTHRRFYTQRRLHTNTDTHRDRTHGPMTSQFYLNFWRSNLISCEKGCTGRFANRNFTSVFGDRTSFRAKGLRRTLTNRNFTSLLQIAILHQFLAIEPHFVRSCDGNPEIAILLEFLAIEPHFVRKGCAGRFANRNFTSVFGDRTSFRVKGLRRTLCKSQF